MIKSKSLPPGPFDSFELTLSDVYLLTAYGQGEVAVPGLKVVVDPIGLTVIKPDGAVTAVLAWENLQSLRTGERMQLPSGTPTVVVEAASNGRTHRFGVPTDDPDGLETVIGDLATARQPSVERAAAAAAASSRRQWWRRR
jgi:hypothetical protein